MPFRKNRRVSNWYHLVERHERGRFSLRKVID